MALRKRKAVLDGARAVFFACDYAGASMDEIAKTARVSKATIYAYHDSKEALFTAIVERDCKKLMSDVEGIVADCDDLRLTLTKLATRLVNFTCDEDFLSLYRICISEAHRQPKIARAFHAAGPGFARGLIERYLKRQTLCGALLLDCAAAAAEQFIQLSFSGLMVDRLLATAGKPNADEAVKRAELAVEIFIAAYAPRPG